MKNMYTDKSDRNPNKPLYTLALLGLGFIAFGVFMYFDLNAWESTNEQKQMHSIMWLLYDFGGKLAVSGFFGVIGSLCIFIGVKKTATLKKIKQDKKF